MDVQLLVVSDCPHEVPAAAVLRDALNEVGLSTTTFATRVVRTQQEADRLGFLGSPSIRINGKDPFGESGRVPALACRLYPSESGLSGVPPLTALRQALERAAGTSRP